MQTLKECRKINPKIDGMKAHRHTRSIECVLTTLQPSCLIRWYGGPRNVHNFKWTRIVHPFHAQVKVVVACIHNQLSNTRAASHKSCVNHLQASRSIHYLVLQGQQALCAIRYCFMRLMPKKIVHIRRASPADYPRKGFRWR